MTKSELHAVMVGGFATIAGGVLAAYIKFGVSPVSKQQLYLVIWLSEVMSMVDHQSSL